MVNNRTACVDAHFIHYLDRKYRLAFLLYEDCVISVDTNYAAKVMMELSKEIECSKIAASIAEAYLDAKSTILFSSRKLYYTQLLRLLGPIIMSEFFRKLLSSEENEIVEAGKAISIIENIIGISSVNKIEYISVQEKTIALELILLGKDKRRVAFKSPLRKVSENYTYLYRVDKRFRDRVNEILNEYLSMLRRS